MKLAAGRPSATAKAKAMTLADMEDRPQMKRVNFDITAEQHRQLKVYAAQHGTNIKDLMSAYIAQLLEANK